MGEAPSRTALGLQKDGRCLTSLSFFPFTKGVCGHEVGRFWQFAARTFKLEVHD